MTNRLPFTHDDIEQILRVVDKLNDVEVSVEIGELKLHVRKGNSGGPTDAPKAPASLRASEPAAAEPRTARASTPAKRGDVRLPEGAIAIRAPMLGTFYRAQSPSDPPFVEIGQTVSRGDQVCLIEVMKLFNSVNADVEGKIIDIPVQNGTMVEFNQVLFVVQPG